MANQLQRGDSFVDGQTVNAARLNNLVDLATALEGLISSQATVTIATTDQLLLLRPGTPNLLKKGVVSTLPGAGTVTSVNWDTGYPQPTTIFNGAVVSPTVAAKVQIGLKPQLANTVLAGPTTGSGVPSFRTLVPTDIPIATVPIAALQINWDLGSTFSKTLAANSPFTFINANAGQTIRVLVLQSVGLYTATFPGTVRWPAGVVPVMTAISGRVDIYTFHYIGGVFYGVANQNFF